MANFSLVAGINRLFGAAIAYEKAGFSVIPVWGDQRPDYAKVAAVDWKMWQFRRPDSHQLTDWFSTNRYTGLALVTGSVSRLLVLDFDHSDLAQQFADRFPELTRTRIVQSATRGLPHYYYRLRMPVAIPSRRLPGVDLLGDGRYVVAPPTSIAGSAYQVVAAGQPMTLTDQQLQQIYEFLDELDAPVPQPIQQTVQSASVLSLEHLLIMLRQYASSGRNQALFQTACSARDAGWSQQQFVDHVLPHFVALKSSVATTIVEQPSRREQEGLRTIASAFKRSPRKSTDSDVPTLPNVLREHLLQTGRTHLARVLDGLLLAGFKPDTVLTEKQIVDALEGQIGRHSVIKSLRELDTSGESVFGAVHPSPTPPTHTFVATATAEEANNTCILFRATQSNKNQRGRPPKYYLLPRLDRLCQRFGLKIRGSDTIKREDLASPATYRRALQRELVRRRPGTYAVGWMAQRLGISRRTVQRYQRTGDIRYQPTYTRTLIGWSNLAIVPDDREITGVFLEDNHNKRYPALRAIAARLLKLGRSVAYVRQGHNTYWHAEQSVLSFNLPIIPLESRVNAPNSRFSAFSVSLLDNSQKAPEMLDSVDSAVRTPSRKEPVAPQPLLPLNPPQRSKRHYRAPLPDHQLEEYALKLYQRIRERCQEKAGYLSMARARMLVERYGHSLLKRVLGVLHWREGIENPAGFVTVWLRSEALKLELQALS